MRVPGARIARAEERLEPQHRTRGIFDDVHVRARELLKREAVAAAVVDRSQIACEEPV
jgi:hypothetical protein